MLSDPQSVYVGGSNVSLPAVSRGENQSVYMSADGKQKLTVSHQYKAERHRFTARLDSNKVAADPLASANNRVYTHSVYFVVDRPTVGYSVAESEDALYGLIAMLQSGTSPNFAATRILRGET